MFYLQFHEENFVAGMNSDVSVKEEIRQVTRKWSYEVKGCFADPPPDGPEPYSRPTN